MRLDTAAAIALVVLLSGPSCSGRNDAPTRAATEITAPEEVLDEPLMVFLAQARNFHHKADVYLHDGQVQQAMKAIREILAIPFPRDAAEVEDVRADARARLAKLLLAQGDLNAAERTVDEGIAAATRESFFVANLHTIRGEIFESRAAAAPEPEQARALRRQAIEALDRSIQINQSIQHKLMRERL